jgi:ABC-type transporter Mla MlaB component
MAFTIASKGNESGEFAGATLDAGATLEIRDVDGGHRMLAQALEAGTPLRIDLSGIGAVDAAGVQLLLALKHEGMRRGIPIEFRGDSAAVKHALTLLGLASDLSECLAS